MQVLGGRRALAPTLLASPFTSRGAGPSRRALLVRASAEGDSEQPQTGEQAQSEAPKRRRRRNKQQQQGLSLEGVATGTIELGRKSREAFDEGGFALLNPITMGRKSREVFDDVWAQLQRLGSSRNVVVVEDDFRCAPAALRCVCCAMLCWGRPASGGFLRLA